MTHMHTHTVWMPWMSDRLAVGTKIRVRTHNPSKSAAADPRLRPRPTRSAFFVLTAQMTIAYL